MIPFLLGMILGAAINLAISSSDVSIGFSIGTAWVAGTVITILLVERHGG